MRTVCEKKKVWRGSKAPVVLSIARDVTNYASGAWNTKRWKSFYIYWQRLCNGRPQSPSGAPRRMLSVSVKC